MSTQQAHVAELTRASPSVAVSYDWRGEWLGAVNAAAASLPLVLAFGFIVYGVLGEDAAQVGLTATMIAVVVGGSVMVAFGRSALPTASPSASTSLILAGAVLPLVRDPSFAVHTPAGTAVLVAACGAVVATSGVLLLVLGALRAGSLVRFVPQPVLAGLMNGIAVLIVVSQLPPLLGLPSGAWARDGWRALASWQGAALLVALATALLMAVLLRRWPRAPAALLAMLAAGLAVAGWQAMAPPGSVASSLPQIGPLLVALPQLALAPLADSATALALLSRHGVTLGLTAVLLALIGGLESALNLASVDQDTHRRSQPDRELVALGLTNIASGVLGGLPLIYLRLRALNTYFAGGRSWRSALLGNLLLGAMVALALPLLKHLSTAVVAGVMVMLAWSLVDRWSRQLFARWWRGDRSNELRWSLLVVALVCAVTVAAGFVAGLGVGILAAMVAFIHALQRKLLSARYDAASFTSRRVHAEADERVLAPLRQHIQIVELEGALFFANADRLLDEGDRLPAGTTDLVLDLRRVSAVDSSGAVALATLARRLAPAGVQVRLAGVTTDNHHGGALAACGLAFTGAGRAAPLAVALHAHADLDRAIEAAEYRALAAVRPAGPADRLTLAQCQLAHGLDDRQLALLAAQLQPRELKSGERLFAEGDAGDGLYLLVQGSISVCDRASGQRFASFSPGMCFGETAVLDSDGGGRTADAVADLPSTVLALPAASLATLHAQDPALAAQLYRNLASHLSQRLRAAASGWRRSAR
jgi:sulfate permease, SulP family